VILYVWSITQAVNISFCSHGGFGLKDHFCVIRQA